MHEGKDKGEDKDIDRLPPWQALRWILLSAAAAWVIVLGLCYLLIQLWRL